MIDVSIKEQAEIVQYSIFYFSLQSAINYLLWQFWVPYWNTYETILAHILLTLQ